MKIKKESGPIPEPERGNISFSTLCTETRTDIRKYGFKGSIRRAFKRHHIAPEYRKVLYCGLYAEIKKENWISPFPRSKEDLTKYVKILLDHEVDFSSATERAFRQYKIVSTSQEGKDWFNHIRTVLNRRPYQTVLRDRGGPDHFQEQFGSTLTGR